MITVFHNPYVRKKLAGHLIVKQVQIGASHYYMIIEHQSGYCENNTLVPIQFGIHTFSQYDLLELYAGKSLKVCGTLNQERDYFHIVAVNYTVKKERVGECCFGISFMNLTTILPCHSKQTGKMTGYICQNIYIPKTIRITETAWTIDECAAATLAYHGKIIDANNGRAIAVMNFKEVRKQTAKEDKVVFVRFVEMQYEESEVSGKDWLF